MLDEESDASLRRRHLAREDVRSLRLFCEVRKRELVDSLKARAFPGDADRVHVIERWYDAFTLRPRGADEWLDLAKRYETTKTEMEDPSARAVRPRRRCAPAP